MDLKDLKKTWDKLASGKELNEGQIREMLGKRTKNLIERIDRNIRIGFFILFALILVFILNDFVLSPELVKNFEKELELPTWLQILSVFGDMIIILTFLIFVARYYKVRKICDETCDLKNTLIKIISTLNFYRTLYYISIFIILISFSINFIAGVYEGFLYNCFYHPAFPPFNYGWSLCFFPLGVPQIIWQLHFQTKTYFKRTGRN